MADTSGILVWNTRDPLRGLTPEHFELALREKLQGRVDQAWLFGSWGSKDFGRDSDVDLLLVVQTDKPFLERARDYFDVMDLALEMDLLVYTPEEFKSFTDEPSPGFWTSVVASMKRVV
ncbi:MAG: nucleotidyltransferase domain-containing protein [Spirochaetota bacterium]